QVLAATATQTAAPGTAPSELCKATRYSGGTRALTPGKSGHDESPHLHVGDGGFVYAPVRSRAVSQSTGMPGADPTTGHVSRTERGMDRRPPLCASSQSSISRAPGTR